MVTLKVEALTGAVWAFHSQEVALRWPGPGYAPKLVLDPYKPTGAFVSIDAPKWDRALDTRADFKAYAEAFFNGKEG